MIRLGGNVDGITRVHGDIIASYQTINDEAAMVLWPRRRKNVPAFVLCMSAAYKYDDPHYLAAQAKHICGLWGWSDVTQWYRVAKVINDGLEDLLRLPPAPEQDDPKGAAMGEMSLTLDGKTIRESDIRVPTADELLKVIQ